MTNPLEKTRANNRNSILKTFAEAVEADLPPIPKNYKFPFNPKKCMYCEGDSKPGKFDEFLAITETGRMNAVNKVPCCGDCNSSKLAKCNRELLKWIENGGFKNTIKPKRQKAIIEWWKENEKHMYIPADIFDKNDIATRCLISSFEYQLRVLCKQAPKLPMEDQARVL